MVRRAGPLPAVATLLVVPLLLVVTTVAIALLAPAAALADEVTSFSYDVEETFTITLSANGDAAYKDVLQYDPDFFNTQGFDFQKYPFLLSRRYRAKMAADEIRGFKAHLDRETATVTLTFREPGRAYNMGDHWTVYGFYEKPRFEVDGKQVFEDESTVNSDYTLWQDLDFKTTTFVKLPAGATHVRWSKSDNALLYDLAYAEPAQGNILQDNQALFIALFAVLAAGSLVVGATAILRGRRGAAAQPALAGGGPAALPGGGGPAGLPGGAAAQLPGRAGPAQLGSGPEPWLPSGGGAAPEGGPGTGPDTAEPATDPEKTELYEPVQGEPVQAHFCRHCGAPLPQADCHFCPTCGGQLGDR